MEEDNWAMVSVQFDATPEDQPSKVEAINAALEPLFEIHRPTCRSQIAWGNGTLSYVYEASFQAREITPDWSEAIFYALASVGLVNRESAVAVS